MGGEPLRHHLPVAHLGGDRVPQYLEGPTRHPLPGLAAERQRVRAEARDQLLEQAGLADAGLAADKRHTCVEAGAGVEELAQARQFTGAPDHHRA